MRPRGEIRQALASAAEYLVRERGHFTYKDAAATAQVAFEKARLTVKDMVSAGELAVVGQTRAPGVSKPLNLYAQPRQAAGQASAELLQVVQRWADFR
jgi:hypothetical protein